MSKRGFITAILSLVLLASGAFAADMGDKDTAIKIPINEWTGQHLSAHMLGQLLSKMGYQVDYVTAGAVPQLTAIGQGDLHVQPETWENNAGEIFPQLVDAGKIVIVGTEGLSAREGWMYPTYMKDKCPGLPHWEALYDCATAFGNAETFPDGRLITYPADWGTHSKDLVSQINLPFVPVAGGSEGAMVAELKSAYDAKEPILMMFWQPHWIHADYEFDWVDWPTDAAACEKKAGLAAGSVAECGFQQAAVYKIVWNGFKDKWPAAYTLIEKFQMTNAQQNPMILEVDKNKRKPEKVAADWISQNEAIWKPWIDVAKN